MKSKLFFIFLFIALFSINGFAFNITSYLDTNDVGQKVVKVFITAKFSEFPSNDSHQFRITYKFYDANGNLIKKDRDFRPYNSEPLKKINQLYFTSSSWFFPIQGNNVIKISIIDLATKTRLKNSAKINLTNENNHFLDNIILLSTNKIYPYDKIYFGNKITFLTRVKSNKYFQWDFHIYDANNHSLYSIKTSTSYKTGIVSLATDPLNSLNFKKGSYKAVFKVYLDKKTFVNSRVFEIDSPEFQIDLNNYKPLTFTGKNNEALNANMEAAYNGFITSAFYKGKSIVGLISSNAYFKNNYDGTTLNLHSYLYFNDKKQIIDWDVVCYTNDNIQNSNEINIDFANNSETPIYIDYDNPILATYREKNLSKSYKVQRKNELIFPYVQGLVPYENNYIAINTFLPTLYQFLRTVLNVNFSADKYKLDISQNFAGTHIIFEHISSTNLQDQFAFKGTNDKFSLQKTANLYAKFRKILIRHKHETTFDYNDKSIDGIEYVLPIYNLHLFENGNNLIGFYTTMGIKGLNISE